MTDFRNDDDVVINTIVKDENGNPLDITGASLLFVLSRTRDVTPVLTQAAIINDPLVGDVSVILTDVQTINLIGDFIFQLQMTDSGGLKSTVSDGVMSVERKISVT